VTGQYLANQFGSELGYGVRRVTLTTGQAVRISCHAFFQIAIIPQPAWSVHAQRPLRYIPEPNLAAVLLDLGSGRDALRWDVIMPWYESYSQIQTLVPGEQSVVFPGPPRGLLYPATPESRAALRCWGGTISRRGSVSPVSARRKRARADAALRFRQDQHPDRIRPFLFRRGRHLGRCNVCDAPYGSTYISPAPSLFANPFVTSSTGFDNGQRYPALDASSYHPDPNVDWSPFLPISGLPGYHPANITRYSEQDSLSIQRQFGKDHVGDRELPAVSRPLDNACPSQPG
jgi:hypothetical protein